MGSVTEALIFEEAPAGESRPQSRIRSSLYSLNHQSVIHSISDP
jgi:hypothetical protein